MLFFWGGNGPPLQHFSFTRNFRINLTSALHRKDLLGACLKCTVKDAFWKPFERLGHLVVLYRTVPLDYVMLYYIL